MSESAPHPVPHHRAAHGPADHEPDPGRLVPAVADQQVPGQQAAPRPAAAAHRQGELRAPPHPGPGGEHQHYLPGSGSAAAPVVPAWGSISGACLNPDPRPRAGQALSRVRLLRLRAASTARPARVRIRRRNPCFLARRRLLG
jgi:hypothetical protein